MSDFSVLHQEAHEAGAAAAAACVPAPMVVGSPSSIFGGDIDPSKPVYYVADGPCGFAWVKFKGNVPFGRWAKKAGIARSAYGGGLQLWVSGYGQSVAKKEAYAQAYARALRAAGVDAYAESRLD
jgi:hypothetical protein